MPSVRRRAAKKRALSSPEVIRARLVQQVPPGTPGAFKDALFGFWWTTRPQTRGLNGPGGFDQVEENLTLTDTSYAVIQLPPIGSDGIAQVDRWYYFRDTPDPQLQTYPSGASTGNTIGYMPGDEWVEIRRGTKVAFVGTPVSETTSQSEVSITCNDVTQILLKARETAAGYWNHAFRDVFEHYCRAWQAVIAEDFQDSSQFSVLNSSTATMTPNGKWLYVGAAAINNGLLTLAPPQNYPAYLRLNPTFPGIPLDHGCTDHSCWRVEVTIANVSLTPNGMIELAVNSTGQQNAPGIAMVISPALGQVTAEVGDWTSTWGVNDYVWTNWPMNSAGLVVPSGSSTAQSLTPPYTLAIEARERWVYFYLNGQQVSVAPRMPLFSFTMTPADPQPAIPMLNLVDLEGASSYVQVDQFVMRKTTPAMNGGVAGDYMLPSPPSVGGLQGAYFDTTMTAAGTTNALRYDVAPPTLTPNAVRTDPVPWFGMPAAGVLSPPATPAAGLQTVAGGSLSAGTWYYRVTALNGQGETTASAEATLVATGAPNTAGVITWNVVNGATSYNVYRGVVSGGEQLLANVNPGNAAYVSPSVWSWVDLGVGSGGGNVPPTTNTATVPGSVGWFPSPLQAASNAYVRWTGAIYLPLGGGQPVTVQLQSTNISQALWIGRTRVGEAVCMSDSGAVGAARGVGPFHTDFPAETVRQTSVDLRTVLGDVTGWYPLRFEFVWRATDPTGGTIVGFAYDTGGGYLPTTPYQLSPYGCFTGQVADGDSHFDTIHTTIPQACGLQWISEPRPLEDPVTPFGVIIPRIRVGRAVDVPLTEDGADNPQESSTAKDNATNGRAQGAGLGGSRTGQVTAEAFNFGEIAAHPFVLSETESLPATTDPALLALQMETLLALRSEVFQQFASDTTAPRAMADTWPLTGALAEFDWIPGDSLMVTMPSLGVVDQTPRQIQTLKRLYYQDGVGQNSVGFRPRPRDFEYTMRRFIKQVYSQRRQYQGQIAYAPTSVASNPGVSSAALPVDIKLVRSAVLQVLAKTDGTPFTIMINGQATGQTITVTGETDVSSSIGYLNGVQPIMQLQLVNGGAASGIVTFVLKVAVQVPL